MSVLLLRLAGPLQSWGARSRFRVRETERFPTKSGVLGLLAAASGRRRTGDIDDLLGLEFGVRVDQPGTLLTDFQTVHTSGMDKPPIVTTRQYLADSVFVAAVEGDASLIGALSEALDRPAFPLFLGRRSCPMEGRLNLGTVESSLEHALREVPWQASPHHRRRQPRSVYLRMVLDVDAEAAVAAQVHDNPYSFDPGNRQYGWRSVREAVVEVSNPQGRTTEGGLTDWFEGLGA